MAYWGYMVLLFLSDANLIRSGITNQTLYSKIIHVTCLAHSVHKLTENLQDEFSNNYTYL
jgi:hypothetical protein